MLPDAACVEPAGNFLAKCERLVHIPGGHGQDAIEMLALDPELARRIACIRMGFCASSQGRRGKQEKIRT